MSSQKLFFRNEQMNVIGLDIDADEFTRQNKLMKETFLIINMKIQVTMQVTLKNMVLSIQMVVTLQGGGLYIQPEYY